MMARDYIAWFFKNDFHLMLFQALSSPVLSAVGERYYKVTAEALRVCGELVRVVRPNIEVRLVLISEFEILVDHFLIT